MSDASLPTSTPHPLTKVAAGLAAAAAAVWIALAAMDHDGAAWLLVAVFGAAAAVTGWMAGHGRKENMTALVALVVGVVAVLTVVLWIVIDAA